MECWGSSVRRMDCWGSRVVGEWSAGEVER